MMGLSSGMTVNLACVMYCEGGYLRSILSLDTSEGANSNDAPKYVPM